MRQSWNLRRNPRGRPHCLQRLRLRTENFGLRSALTMLEIFAIEPVLLLAERHAELAQKEARLLVVLRRGDDGDVHALRLVDLARIDLGKDQVVADAEGVVAAAVERLRRHAAEVAHAGQRDVDQAVEELVHLVPAQRDHRPDGNAFAQLERRDGLLGPRHDRLLAGDLAQLVDGRVEDLRVRDGLAHAHVQDDLLDLRQRHDVLDLELVLELLPHFALVFLFESGSHGFFLVGLCTTLFNSCYFPISAWQLLQKRAEPSSERCVPVRLGLLQLGQTTCSFEVLIGASRSAMPPLTFFWGFGRVCFLRKFTRSTMAVPLLAMTRRTRPCLPRSRPERTTTVSPLRTCDFTRGCSFCRWVAFPYMDMSVTSDRFRRERDDLHELPLAELAGHGAEDAGPDRLAGVIDENRRVVVELYVRAVAAGGVPPLGGGDP